jgi:hypothetical protein
VRPSRNASAALSTAAHIELSQRRGDGVVDRLFGHDHALCDLLVAQRLGEQRQHLELAGGEAGRAGRVLTRA